MTDSTLQQVLLLLASGAMGYWPVFAFVEKAGHRDDRFGRWWMTQTAFGKRLVVIALTVVIALVGWISAVALGYVVAPVSARAWLEAGFDLVWKVSTAAFTASQVRHAREETRDSS
jgi:hypothetical protein